MDINKNVNEASEQEGKKALIYFIKEYMSPAYGALPKNEIEIIVLNTLEKLKAIDKEPELYELVSKLKITRSSALCAKNGWDNPARLRQHFPEEICESPSSNCSLAAAMQAETPLHGRCK